MALTSFYLKCIYSIKQLIGLKMYYYYYYYYYYMTFNADDNKKMLWDVLEENGNFSGIRPSFFKNIHYEFNNTINEIDRATNNLSLMEKNKQFMENFTYKLKTFTSVPVENYSLVDINETQDTQKFKQIRQEQLSNDFNNKKSEMDNLLIAKKPNDIDFSELGNDEPIKDIDSILERTIQQRNLDINNITSESYDKTKAEKWIGNEKKITFKEEPENIVIETTEISSESANESIYLPPPPPPPLKLNTEIIDLLKKILTNQDEILTKLNHLPSDKTKEL